MRFAIAASVALFGALALGACNDSTGVQDGVVSRDTVMLAAPTVDSVALPSALDLTLSGAGRFPERSSDAGQWDVALRLVAGQLYLRPASGTGTRLGAGILGPTSDQFEQLKTVPSRSNYPDSTVLLQVGKTYQVHSRQGVDIYGGSCYYYGKLTPVALNPAAGTARVALRVNSTCNDRRVSE
ncbi:MAG TPA: hypothetical protein VFH27_14285 [Longimicrobiaceae bacterium]|nr:hypothetical protein [Longimicrobiaceae bacterium]